MTFEDDLGALIVAYRAKGASCSEILDVIESYILLIELGDEAEAPPPVAPSGQSASASTLPASLARLLQPGTGTEAAGPLPPEP